jgi:hypothetical protein
MVSSARHAAVSQPWSPGGTWGVHPSRDMTGATTVRLVRNWGRIGTNGQELVEVFTNEIEAGEALEALARVKRRRGYRDL